MGKKKILLISLYEDVSSIGIRYISSYLKANGINVAIIHLIELLSKKQKYVDVSVSEKNINLLLKKIDELCPDYIGIGVMTNYFEKAVSVTKKIKQMHNIPVIFGGIHSTICPEECLESCDIACIGEAEETILEICKSTDIANIKGIAYKKDGKVIKTELMHLEENLDKYPFPDLSFENEYIIYNDEIKKFDRKNIFEFLHKDPYNNVIHRIMTSRGCPFSCTYCCNNTLKKLYTGKGKYLRGRSVKNVIDEMLDSMRKLPINGFRIMDDSFLFHPLGWVKEFNKEYKEKIHLPFSCLSSPLNIDSEKIKLLVGCGLRHLQLGLQTGSDKINFDIYERKVTQIDFLKALEIIYSLNPTPNLTLDIIFDNPFESEEDKLQTLNLLKKIKIPFKIGAFALTYYPKTKLYEMAEKRGIINESVKKKIYKTSYHQIEQNDLNNQIMGQGSTWETIIGVAPTPVEMNLP